MSMEQEFTPIKTFTFEGNTQPVTFVETMEAVADGVDCDVYTFNGDPTKDLGIIKIQPGKKTPLQKVLQGDQTIEGFISGKGKLTITRTDGTKAIYPVDDEKHVPEHKPFQIEVKIGETMQWEATSGETLTAYEICFPPYQDGRYENLIEGVKN